jgi:hypothetical protein
VATLRRAIASTVVSRLAREELGIDGAGLCFGMVVNTDARVPVRIIRERFLEARLQKRTPTAMVGVQRRFHPLLAENHSGWESLIDHFIQSFVILIGQVSKSGFEVAMAQPSLDRSDRYAFPTEL